jgi:hypothetical protein
MLVRMKVTFPANSYNAKGLENSAVSQLCDIRLFEVMMRFKQDEWYCLILTHLFRHALNGGELINVTFPGENLTIYNSIANKNALPHSDDIYFDEVAEHLEVID